MLLTAVTFWPSSLGGRATMLIVHGDSMLPSQHNGDLVVAWSQPTYRVGELVAFAANLDRSTPLAARVMHRITAVNADQTIRTQGDNRSTADTFFTTPEDVLGKVGLTIPRGGYLLWILSRWWTLGALGGAMVGMRLLPRRLAGSGWRPHHSVLGLTQGSRDELPRDSPIPGDLGDRRSLCAQLTEHLDPGQTTRLFEPCHPRRQVVLARPRADLLGENRTDASPRAQVSQ